MSSWADKTIHWCFNSKKKTCWKSFTLRYFRFAPVNCPFLFGKNDLARKQLIPHSHVRFSEVHTPSVIAQLTLNPKHVLATSHYLFKVFSVLMSWTRQKRSFRILPLNTKLLEIARSFPAVSGWYIGRRSSGLQGHQAPSPGWGEQCGALQLWWFRFIPWVQGSLKSIIKQNWS